MVTATLRRSANVQITLPVQSANVQVVAALPDLNEYVKVDGLANTVAELTAGLTANNANYLNGNTALDLRNYSEAKAANAYSNAVAYSGNAAQAYSNAVSYADSRAANAYSNAIAYSGNAAQAYSNAIAYSGNAAQAYSNAVSYVTSQSFVNTSQLSSNLSNYALLAGDTFTGKVTFGNSTVNTSVNAGSISTNNITLRANGYIDFNTTTYKPSWQTGRLYYDNEEKTWIGYGDGTDFELSLGQREWVRCRNGSGVVIPKGSPVYVTGVHISGDPVHGHHPTIALADASDETKKDVLGLAGENIGIGQHGYVVVRGYIEGIDTSALAAGQRVHLGFSAPGILQTVAPEYPNWPMDVGVCLTSNATVGTLYVNINDHSVERFRVAQDAVVGGDLRVGGGLYVTGNVTTTSAVNLSVDQNIIYLGGGDTITTTNFVGSGLNDMTFHGVFEGTSSTNYYVKIDSTGTPDTFAWSYDNFITTEASGIAITGSRQSLADGISVEFQATTGHTLNNSWNGTAGPVNVDLGLGGNYNDGAYKHAGIFRDASDGYWKVFDSYLPELNASVDIDTANSSFSIANFWANTYKIGNTTVFATINSTSFTGQANNTLYFNGQLSSYYANTSVVTDTYINATSYADNKAANAYSNAVTFVGSQSFVNTSQLSSNLANYQTEADLAANVATLAANSSTYIVSPTTIINSNYTVLASDSLILANSSSNITITLPAASSVNNRSYEIKNINTGSVTVIGADLDKIDGYDSMTIRYKNSSMGIKSKFNGWVIY